MFRTLWRTPRNEASTLPRKSPYRTVRPCLERLEDRIQPSNLDLSLLADPANGVPELLSGLQAQVNNNIYAVNMPLLGTGLGAGPTANPADSQFLIGAAKVPPNPPVPPNVDVNSVFQSAFNAQSFSSNSQPQDLLAALQQSFGTSNVVELHGDITSNVEFQITVSRTSIQSVQNLSEQFPFHTGLGLVNDTYISVNGNIVSVALDWTMTLDVGQNQSGVYLDTAGTKLAVTVTASIPSTQLAGTFLNLPVTYQDSAQGLAGLPKTSPQPGSSDSTWFSGTFTLQIAPAALVLAAQVVNSTPTVTFDANPPGSNANVLIDLSFVQSDPNSLGLGANLEISWPMGQGAVSGGLLPGASTLPTVALNDVSLTNLDHFVKNLLQPIVHSLTQFFSDSDIDQLLKFLETPIPVISPFFQTFNVPPLTPLEVAEGAGLVDPDTVGFINFVDTLLYKPLPAELTIGNADLGSLTLPANIDVRSTDLLTDFGALALNYDTGNLLTQLDSVSNQLFDLIETLLPNHSDSGALNVPLLDPQHGLAVAEAAFGITPQGDSTTPVNQVLLSFTSPVLSIGPARVPIPGLSDPGIPIYPPFFYLSFTPNFTASGSVSFGIDSQGLVNGNAAQSFFFFNPPGGPPTGIDLSGGISANLQGSIGVAAAGGGLSFNANVHMALNSQLTAPTQLLPLVGIVKDQPFYQGNINIPHPILGIELTNNVATVLTDQADVLFPVGSWVNLSVFGRAQDPTINNDIFNGMFQVTATTSAQSLSNGGEMPASFSFKLTHADVPFQLADPTVAGSISGSVTNATVLGSITNVALSNNVATITMSAGNALLAAGQSVVVNVVRNSLFNGTFQVTAATPTSFSYDLNHADVASQSDSGTVRPPGVSGTITNVALSDDVATLTSVGANTYLSVGQSVVIAGLANSMFNGTFQVTAVTPTTFSYLLLQPDTPPPADVPAQPDSGIATATPFATTVNVVTLQDINTITSAGGAGYSPLCIFGANDTGLVNGGTVSVGLDYYVRIGFPPFGAEINNNFGDLVLFDFNIDPWTQLSSVPHLATQVGSILQLNLGANASQRNKPSTYLPTESYEIAPVTDQSGNIIPGEVDVKAFGYSQIYGSVTPVTTITADGQTAPDANTQVPTITEEDITVDSGVTADALLIGGGYDLNTGNPAFTNKFDYEGSGNATLIGGDYATNTLKGGSGINVLEGSNIGEYMESSPDNTSNLLTGGDGTTGKITNVSLTGNVATLTVPGGGMPTAFGQTIVVAGLKNAFFDGTYQITAVTPTTLSYNLVHADVASQADSGTVTGIANNALDAGVASATLTAGGRNSANELTAGAGFLLLPDGTERLTDYYLIAGAGSTTMTGGAGINHYQWLEGNGPVTITGANPNNLPNANQLTIIGGAQGGETWKVNRASPVQIQGTDSNGNPIPNTPITPTDLNDLTLDTVGTAGNNSFFVDDLSGTSMRQVILNAHEIQGADKNPDTITIAGSHAANKVTVAVENLKDNNNNPVVLEDVTLQTSDRPSYSVAAAITNANDTLTVNTFEGDDQVQVLSTTGPGSTHINTGAGTAGGGNNRIIVGNDQDANGFDAIEGPLFIDAGNGTGNSLLFTEAASLAPDNLTLTKNSLIRYQGSNLPSAGDTPAHKRYAFTITYTATGGAFGGTAATANTPAVPGIELDTTQKSDTIYVASTPVGSNVTINTGTANPLVEPISPPPAQGPNPPHDQVYVGFDGGNPQDPESASTLDGVLSPVTVIGGGAAFSGVSYTDLVVADQAATKPEAYRLYANELYVTDLVSSGFRATILFNQSSSVVTQVTDLTLLAGPKSNKIYVGSTNAATTTTVNAGSGSNAIQVFDGVPPSITGTSDLNSIAGPLSVVGGGSNNTLDLNDSANGYPETYTLGVTTNAKGQVTGGTFARAGESIQIVPGVYIPEIPVNVTYSGISKLTFESSDAATLGIGGPILNTINISGTLLGTMTTVLADDVITNQVTVSDLNAIQGALTLQNPAGNANTLTVDDSADTTPGTYVVTASTIQGQGSALITYSSFSQVSLLPAQGVNDQVNVQGTEAGTSYTIGTDLNHGTDTFIVGDTGHTLNEILGPVQFVGFLAAQKLTIDDEGEGQSAEYDIYSDHIVNRAAAITFSNLIALTLKGGYGGNTIKVYSIAGASSLDVEAGAGNDSVNVEALTAVQGFLNHVTINDHGGNDSLSVEDAGTTTSDYVINGTQVGLGGTGSGQPISYSGFTALTLNLNGAANDTVECTPSATAAYSIHGDATQFQAGFGATLNLLFFGATNPVGPTVPGNGTWTFGNRAPVSYTNMGHIVAAVPTALIPSGTFGGDTPGFFWNGLAGAASYELWISDQTAQTVQTIPNIAASATSYTLTTMQALTPGDTYIWYVAAVDANGQDIWSNALTFTITALGAPTATTPNTSQTTDQPTFSWTLPAKTGTPAGSYELWIFDQTSQSVLTPLPTAPHGSTSYTLTASQALTPGHSFVWEVGAVSTNGKSVVWSNAVIFSIAALTAPPTPETPDGPIGVDEPTFFWMPATGMGTQAASYELWIFDQTTQSLLTFPNLPFTSTTYSLTSQALTPGDSYLWYVGAVSANGQATAWSGGVTFSIAALGTPMATTPSAPVVLDQPTFQWTPAAGFGAQVGSYELWILDQNTQNLLTVPGLAPTSTSYTLTASEALTPGDIFTWYVGAVSTNGLATVWSNAATFSVFTVGGPGAGPMAGAPNSPISMDQPTFSWTPATGGTPAVSYELWIMDQNSHKLETVPNLDGQSSSYTLTSSEALTPGDSFIWYVGAAGTNGKVVAWSNAVTFSIASLGAGPTATTPNTPQTTDQPTFSWTPAAATGTLAASYELWILDQNTGTIQTIPNVPIGSMSYALTAQALTPGHSFLWYVGAVSTNGLAISWSNGVTFSIAGLGGAPTAATPNTQQVTDQPTFSWTAGAATGTLAATYELWILDQNTHNVETVPNVPIGSTSYTLNTSQALTPGDSFLWYVGAASTNGQAVAWSNGVTFSIAALTAPTATMPDLPVTDQPTFFWMAGAATGTPPASYELWILDESTHNLTTITDLPGTATFYTLTAAEELPTGDSFLWYVGAVSSNGQAVVWSSAGVNFSIQP